MRYWIFQAVPKRYRLAEKMSQLPSERWVVTRYMGEISAGDVVYFWQAGKQAGLHGWGYVRSPEPYPVPGGDHRVEVSYDIQFQPPIPKRLIQEEAGLDDLQVVRAPQGTNFRVKNSEALILNRLIQRHQFQSPPDPPQ